MCYSQHMCNHSYSTLLIIFQTTLIFFIDIWLILIWLIREGRSNSVKLHKFYRIIIKQILVLWLSSYISFSPIKVFVCFSIKVIVSQILYLKLLIASDYHLIYYYLIQYITIMYIIIIYYSYTHILLSYAVVSYSI